MLERIFSCKLYLASSHKARILSNILDPINTELVQQLSSMLDENALIEEESVSNTNTEKRDNEPEENIEESSKGIVINRVPHSTTDEKDTVPDNKEQSDNNTDSLDLEHDNDDSPKETSENDEIDIKESIKIHNKTEIQGSSSIIIDIDPIFGLLNSIDSTAGVARIQKKDNELWVYYEDKINLNSVLEAVISELNSSMYTYLEFNRLARSNNAIVFLINSEDTNTDLVRKELEDEESTE